MNLNFFVAGAETLPDGYIESPETRQLRLALDSLNRLLADLGYNSTTEITRAQLVVFIHPYLEVHLTAALVAQFEFPPSVVKVILLRATGPRMLNGSSPEMYEHGGIAAFALDPLRGIFEALSAFLSQPVDSRRDAAQRPHLSQEDVHDLASAALGFRPSDLKTVLNRIAERKGFSLPQEFARHLLDLYTTGFSDRGASQWRLDYCLELLTSEFYAFRHGSHVTLDRPFDKPGEGESDSPVIRYIGWGADSGQLWQLTRFLDFCADLKETLRTTQSPRQDGQEMHHEKVLLIDDKIAHDLECMRSLVGRLFYGDKDLIETFEPMRFRGEYTPDLLDYLSNYHALRYGSPPTVVQCMLDDLRQKVEAGCRYILVDQFFYLPDERRNVHRGPEFIRGLIRYFEDFGVVLRDGSLPEVIALSRDDDPLIIRAALSAGAKDYIPKSRFLRLPAVLKRVSRSSTDRIRKLHQNFQVLHTLPNETIGLLQSLRIPRIPYHRAGPIDPGLLGEARGATVENDLRRFVENWGNLLGALPKVDLHVHMGSCMSVEFLVYAAFVGLVRLPSADFLPSLRALFRHFLALTGKGEHRIVLVKSFSIGDESEAIGPIPCGVNWMTSLADATRAHLTTMLKAMDGKERGSDNPSAEHKDGLASGRRGPGSNGLVRAALQKSLGVPDYISAAKAIEKIEQKPVLALAVFALKHARDVLRPESTSGGGPEECLVGEDDIKRAYLLFLATRYYKDGKGKIQLFWNTPKKPAAEGAKGRLAESVKVFGAVNEFLEAGKNGDVFGLVWDEARNFFYENEFAHEKFRTRGWSFIREADVCVPLKIVSSGFSRSDLCAAACPGPSDEDNARNRFEQNPIYFTLASGTRSTNLLEYLEGCEFSGAEHLRHPFLIHLYAQQAIVNFVREGIFYVELRGSPDGYVDPKFGFEFGYACRAVLEAFSLAQDVAMDAFKSSDQNNDSGATCGAEPKGWLCHLLGQSFTFSVLKSLFDASKITEAGQERLPRSLRRRLPCKVSLIFVGKRHKSTREMILEAAAVAVMQAPTREARTTSDFVTREFARCRVVGFDLAGQESDNPPELFADEFSRIARLHIPITVHAGENAPPAFIENAILRLRAKRIGHGLSLTEDSALMARAREDRVCVELCPVCNHQTSHFASPSEGGECRKYPLRQLLDAGIFVTINTDNPIISDTNMTKEFFQASYAYDPHGMPLWEALRLLRMGYVCSFLTLRERRHMLELVGQYLFDIFSDEDVVAHLRSLSALA